MNTESAGGRDAQPDIVNKWFVAASQGTPDRPVGTLDELVRDQHLLSGLS